MLCCSVLQYVAVLCVCEKTCIAKCGSGVCRSVLQRSVSATRCVSGRDHRRE